MPSRGGDQHPGGDQRVFLLILDDTSERWRTSAEHRVIMDAVRAQDAKRPRLLAEGHVAGLDGKPGCREQLAEALEPYGIGFERVTDPFNAAKNAGIDDVGRMVIFEPHSRAGDRVDLRAERDLILAVSACAADGNDYNGSVCTSIGLEILPPAA